MEQMTGVKENIIIYDKKDEFRIIKKINSIVKMKKSFWVAVLNL